MKSVVFKDSKKEDAYYARFNEGLISVYLPEGYKPEFKTAKNGKQYFVADVNLYKSYKNNKYSFIVQGYKVATEVNTQISF